MTSTSPLASTSHVFDCLLCLQRVAVPLDHPRARALRRYQQCPECDVRIQAHLAGLKPTDETWPDGVMVESDKPCGSSGTPRGLAWRAVGLRALAVVVVVVLVIVGLCLAVPK